MSDCTLRELLPPPPPPQLIPQGGGAATAVCVSEEDLLLLPSCQTATMEQTKTGTDSGVTKARFGGQEVAALCSGGGNRVKIVL